MARQDADREPATRGAPSAARPNQFDELFGRLPPHSTRAEMSLLGSLILDPEKIEEVVPKLPNSDAFFIEKHAAVYDAIRYVYEHHHALDLVVLAQRLDDVDMLELVGGQEYLLELARSVPTSKHADVYANTVLMKHRLRRLIDLAGDVVHSAYNPSTEQDDVARQIIDSAESEVFKLSEDFATDSDTDFRELLAKAYDAIADNDGRLVTGVSTGYYDLDEMTSGLQPGEMIIVAARPSMGKTALALNLLEQIAFAGRRYEHDVTTPTMPVAFFSLEMGQESVTQRLLSAHSRVDSHLIRTNRLTKEHHRDLQRSCGMLAEAPVFIDDTPGLTVMTLRAKARRLKRRHKIGCIIIDYLQLMSEPSAAREGRQQEVSMISRQIKALARELEVPVVCLAQLNRAAEQREGNRPRMSDLRESGSIEQDADVIALLHRESYYHRSDPDWALDNPDKEHLAELIIAKQRNGPTGVIKLHWNDKITRFSSWAGDAGGRGDAAWEHKPVSTSDVEAAHGVGPDGGPGGGGAPGSAFANRRKTGPEDGHRDGGGPDRDGVDIM